jgi:hypothetical protein
MKNTVSDNEKINKMTEMWTIQHAMSDLILPCEDIE